MEADEPSNKPENAVDVLYSFGRHVQWKLTAYSTYVFCSMDRDFNVSSYWMSPDENGVLLASNKRSCTADRSLQITMCTYLENGSTFRVKPPNPNKQIQLALWGNKGTSIGFVQDITSIGWTQLEATLILSLTMEKKTSYLTAFPDWVYEGEVSRDLFRLAPEITFILFRFSLESILFLTTWPSTGCCDDKFSHVVFSDGRYLVYAQSNDTQVKWFSYMWYGKNTDIYTTVKRIAYPKPGSPNPVVKVIMVDLEHLPLDTSKVPNTTDLKPPVEFKDINVLVWWLNRIQDTSIASICNASSGICTENQKLQVTNGWVNTKSYLPPSPWFAKDGSYYLTLVPSPQGEQGNFIHLAKVMVPSAGKDDTTLPHLWYVGSKSRFWRSIKTAKQCIFKVTETSPRDRHIYSVNVKTKDKKCLTCSLPWAKVNGDCKYFAASFSFDASWYILNCYGPNVPRSTLHKTGSTWYKELQMNKGLVKKMSELSAPKRRNLMIHAGKYDLTATEFLPPNFDENKKYAVHFEV
ncbi:hypothetical protein OS493_034866 [Desmophyllum pertusum]|uniref:Dipeptidylpeptidase IV N-terminal domain-containing protein n=1 Tax=Desmophyllum pertusum TaxID=174260 RepID=A0A9W9ZW37_9CNID|nr:hypothetical protein OS493_034866 [Desmophyllum pertusum]